jgi:hypothetical protein
MTQRERHLTRLCQRLQSENRRLEAENANLCVERDAADVLLGVAMDELLRAQRRGRA